MHDLRLTCNHTPTSTKEEKKIMQDAIYCIEIHRKWYEHYYLHHYYEKVIMNTQSKDRFERETQRRKISTT